jgi:hypothetical protein
MPNCDAWNRDKKKGPGGKPGPKALGNGGVSSREDNREDALARLIKP